jgi:hypothetical protein
MNTKAVVNDLLNKKPYLRDDDNKLCTHIWYKEMKLLGYDPHNISATDFLLLYAKNKVTLAPSIKRARAKIQEENVFLRGKKYYIRKRWGQDKWKSELGYNI